MSAYSPERWVIVRITSKDHPTIDKILGSWYGGFARSDEWRFSSGITKVEPHLDDKYPHYLIHNHSGSVYTCYTSMVGMNAYTSSVYNNMKTKLEESGLGNMEIINIEDVQNDQEKDN